MKILIACQEIHLTIYPLFLKFPLLSRDALIWWK